MVKFNDVIASLKSEYKVKRDNFELEFSKFLVANDWFGEEPKIENGQLYVSDEFSILHKDELKEFCEHYNDDLDMKLALLLKKLRDSYPETFKGFKRYIREMNLADEIAYPVVDFLLTELPGELYYCSDAEIRTLAASVYDQLSKVYGEAVFGFINWLHLESGVRTVYNEVYMLNHYSDRSAQSEAYGETYYLQLLYCLFNAEYIDENDMYAQAAASKDYVDTWLYLAIHFLAALRDTDIIRIPHPILPKVPEEVLKEMEDDTMSDADAILTLNSIIIHLDALRLAPHKTEGTSGIGDIKFHVPVSAQVHMGKLFACAEAHFQLQGLPKSEPLIRRITSYEQINRYMGSEIGDLFLEEDFRTRSANKSFLQMIYTLTDNVIDETVDGFRVNGYLLAALARSHKGGYGQFAETTKIYLQDAKMGLSPEFIERELMERGVLSSIVTMLMKMTYGEQFEKLSVENQTKAIQEIGIDPWEAEQSVQLMQKAVKQSSKTAMAIYQSESDKGILAILHRIGNGEAPSKTDESLCLKTAMKQRCPYPDRTSCIGCPFEIGTESTIFLMASEVKRLQNLYQQADNAVDKERYKHIAVNIVAPKLRELFICLENEYGHDTAETMKNVIREVNNYD